MGIHISPESERLLNEVVATGHFNSQEEALAAALRLLMENGPTETPHDLEPDHWMKKFQKHLDDTPASTATVLDDSRESIYEGRGE